MRLDCSTFRETDTDFLTDCVCGIEVAYQWHQCWTPVWNNTQNVCSFCVLVFNTGELSRYYTHQLRKSVSVTRRPLTKYCPLFCKDTLTLGIYDEWRPFTLHYLWVVHHDHGLLHLAHPCTSMRQCSYAAVVFVGCKNRIFKTKFQVSSTILHFQINNPNTIKMSNTILNAQTTTSSKPNDQDNISITMLNDQAIKSQGSVSRIPKTWSIQNNY